MCDPDYIMPLLLQLHACLNVPCHLHNVILYIDREILLLKFFCQLLEWQKLNARKNLYGDSSQVAKIEHANISDAKEGYAEITRSTAVVNCNYVFSVIWTPYHSIMIIQCHLGS